MNEKRNAETDTPLLTLAQKFDVTLGILALKESTEALQEAVVDQVAIYAAVITHRRVRQDQVRSILIEMQRAVCLTAEGAGLDPKQLTDDVHNGRS